MAERKNFPVYFAWRGVLSALDSEQRGILLMALMDYAENGDEPDGVVPIVRVAFESCRALIDKDRQHYEEVCAKNRLNGNSGGRPRKPTETQQNPTVFSETQQNPGNPTTTTTTTYKEKDTPNGVSKKKSAFAPPALTDAIAFFQAKGSTAEEAEKYYDYYSSNGWRVGKSAMKDWQAAARNWLRNSHRTVSGPQRNGRASAQEQLMQMIQGGGNGDGNRMQQVIAGV